MIHLVNFIILIILLVMASLLFGFCLGRFLNQNKPNISSTSQDPTTSTTQTSTPTRATVASLSKQLDRVESMVDRIHISGGRQIVLSLGVAAVIASGSYIKDDVSAAISLFVIGVAGIVLSRCLPDRWVR